MRRPVAPERDPGGAVLEQRRLAVDARRHHGRRVSLRVLDQDLVARPPVREPQVKRGQASGTHGRTRSVSPASMPTPRMDSSATRYIQPAEPVYHVHPPRPTCGGAL